MVFYLIRKENVNKVFKSITELKKHFQVDKEQALMAVKNGELNGWEVLRISSQLPKRAAKKVTHYVHDNKELKEDITKIRVEIEDIKSFLAKLIWQIQEGVKEELAEQEEEKKE